MSDKEYKASQKDEQPAIDSGVVDKHRFAGLPKKWLLLAGGILIAVAVAVGGSLLLHSKSKPVPKKDLAFTINNHDYSKAEVKKIISYPTSKAIDANKASQQAFDYLKKQDAAKSIGVEPSEQQIKSARKTIFQADADSKALASDSWLQLASYNLALDNLISQSSDTGTAQGYSFVFRFGEHLEKGAVYTPPGYKDPELVAQDRAYAEGRAKYYLDKLKNKQLTPDQALAEIKSDPKLGYSNRAGSNRSVHFGISDQPWSEELLYHPIVDFIKTDAKQGLNDIKAGKTLTVPGSKVESDYTETFFYFVLLDKGPTLDFKNKFNNAFKKLPAQYYGL